MFSNKLFKFNKDYLSWEISRYCTMSRIHHHLPLSTQKLSLSKATTVFDASFFQTTFQNFINF